MLKIIGWIFLGFLLFVFLLLFLPVHTRVRYDGAVQVWCGLGPVSLRLFPLKKKAERPKKKRHKLRRQSLNRKKRSQRDRNSHGTRSAIIFGLPWKRWALCAGDW